MSQLVINDLPNSTELDRAAREAVFGGISFGWIKPFVDSAPVAGPSGMSFFNITNNFITNDYTVIEQNPTNIFVNNGGGNSGPVLNNITAMPIQAASPTFLSQGA